MAEITDDHVILLERTLQTNKDVIAENRKLQDELKLRDEEHNQVLHNVLKDLQELKESPISFDICCLIIFRRRLGMACAIYLKRKIK